MNVSKLKGWRTVLNECKFDFGYLIKFENLVFEMHEILGSSKMLAKLLPLRIKILPFCQGCPRCLKFPSLAPSQETQSKIFIRNRKF